MGDVWSDSPLMLVVDLEKMSYQTCLQIQERCHAARVAKTIDDVLLLVEHEPVVTFGRSADERDLLISKEEMAKRGISVYRTSRGGKITCHYPGQLVAYPIIDLKNSGIDLHTYVRGLEETIMRSLGDFGINSSRADGFTGVWVGETKIASIGVAVKKWVTMHGFSINIAEDLETFSLFVPCGIKDGEMTAVHRLLGSPDLVDSRKMKEAVTIHFSEVFHLPITPSLNGEQLERRLVGGGK
jgi:lipoate-protein ligase B